MAMLQVGNRALDVEKAQEVVSRYLNSGPGDYAYPSYDGCRTNDDPSRLCDADLLAPVLLNVQVKIRTFANLAARRTDLESALRGVPDDVDLADANDATLASVGRLFAILESEERLVGARGTIVAKILHRKRPGLVPLYDQNVRRVYQEGDDARVPPDRTRSWQEFMTRLAAAMRDDLKAAPGVWDTLAALAPEGGPPVSRLRALDIVAWELGKPVRAVSPRQLRRIRTSAHP